MKKNNKGIAVVFDDLVEFFNMKNGLDALIKDGIPVDIIVPKHNEGRRSLLDETYDYLTHEGYSVIRDVDKSKKYKILLEPYPTDHNFKPDMINHEFRIKYKYSLISAKPDKVFSVKWNIVYDAILCYTKREVEILSAYTKTFLVSPMKYKDFKKNSSRPSKKPTLLYLPTFGDVSSIDDIKDALKSLRNDYYVIVKAHHGTQHKGEEKKRNDILKNSSDEYYDQTTDLAELLKTADVVLSDNSAAIFDAIYTEVPVAIYNNGTLNARKLGNLNTYQYQLVQKGVVPYTDDINKVGLVLKSALKKRKEQMKEKDDFSSNQNMTKEFIEIIKIFLEKDRDEDEYYAMHDFIRDSFVNRYQKEADEIKNSKTWKIGNAVTFPYRFILKFIRK
jgi:hypothetical protein